MFSVRLVTADSYQAQPLPQLDPTFSEFRGSEIKHVPIIRVFGTTSNGEKTCLHIHGVFPYLYVPYTGEEEPASLAYRLAASLDAAINVSLGSATSNTQHVYSIQRVSGIPFYGYHKKEHQFLKIHFYSPAMMKRGADLLQNGSVLNQSLQPHEAHIPYILQFMMDYNIYGMSMINMSSVKHRREAQSLAELGTSGQSANSENSEIEYLPTSVERQSTCSLEIDALASDILNRRDIESGLDLNPGLAAIWDEERARRAQAGFEGGDSQLVNPKSPPRPTFQPTDNDIYQDQRLNRRLLMLSQCDESTLSSTPNQSVAYAAEVRDDENLLNSSCISLPSVRKTQTTPQENPMEISTFHNSSLIVESQKLSQDCNILGTDDMSLVDLLADLANDEIREKPESIDTDSLLGSQASILPNNENPDSDNEDEDVPDMNLTFLQLDSLSASENPRNSVEQRKESSIFLQDENSLSTVHLSPFLTPDDVEKTLIPQYDGADDLSPNRLNSTEAEKIAEKSKDLENGTFEEILTINKNPSELLISESLQNSTNDYRIIECAEETVVSESYLGYNEINDEPFENFLEIGQDFIPDLEDMHSSMENEILCSNGDSESTESVCQEVENVSLDAVLNGDPCFTESAEIDKSDITELQDQYASLLGNSLLPDVEIDAGTSVNFDTSFSDSDYQGNEKNRGICEASRESSSSSENVTPNIQEITDFKNCLKNKLTSNNRKETDNSDYNCNFVATWAELQIRDEKRSYGLGNRKISSLSQSRRKSDNRRSLPDKTSQLIVRSPDNVKFQNGNMENCQSSPRKIIFRSPLKKSINAILEEPKASNLPVFEKIEETSTSPLKTVSQIDEENCSILRTAALEAFHRSIIGSESSLAGNKTQIPESEKIVQNFEKSEEIDDSSFPKIEILEGTSYYSPQKSENNNSSRIGHFHCFHTARGRKILKDQKFLEDKLYVIKKRKQGKQILPDEKICTKGCEIPVVLLRKIDEKKEITEDTKNSSEKFVDIESSNSPNSSIVTKKIHKERTPIISTDSSTIGSSSDETSSQSSDWGKYENSRIIRKILDEGEFREPYNIRKTNKSFCDKNKKIKESKATSVQKKCKKLPGIPGIFDPPKKRDRSKNIAINSVEDKKRELPKPKPLHSLLFPNWGTQPEILENSPNAKSEENHNDKNCKGRSPKTISQLPKRNNNRPSKLSLNSKNRTQEDAYEKAALLSMIRDTKCASTREKLKLLMKTRMLSKGKKIEKTAKEEKSKNELNIDKIELFNDDTKLIIFQKTDEKENETLDKTNGISNIPNTNSEVEKNYSNLDVSKGEFEIRRKNSETDETLSNEFETPGLSSVFDETFESDPEFSQNILETENLETKRISNQVDRYAINVADFSTGNNFTIEAVSPVIPNCLFEEDSNSVERLPKKLMENYCHVEDSTEKDSASMISVDPCDLEVYDVESLTASSLSDEDTMYKVVNISDAIDTENLDISNNSDGGNVAQSHFERKETEDSITEEDSPEFEALSPNPKISQILQKSFTEKFDVDKKGDITENNENFENVNDENLTKKSEDYFSEALEQFNENLNAENPKEIISTIELEVQLTNDENEITLNDLREENSANTVILKSDENGEETNTSKNDEEISNELASADSESFENSEKEQLSSEEDLFTSVENEEKLCEKSKEEIEEKQDSPESQSEKEEAECMKNRSDLKKSNEESPCEILIKFNKIDGNMNESDVADAETENEEKLFDESKEKKNTEENEDSTSVKKQSKGHEEQSESQGNSSMPEKIQSSQNSPRKINKSPRGKIQKERNQPARKCVQKTENLKESTEDTQNNDEDSKNSKEENTDDFVIISKEIEAEKQLFPNSESENSFNIENEENSNIISAFAKSAEKAEENLITEEKKMRNTDNLSECEQDEMSMENNSSEGDLDINSEFSSLQNENLSVNENSSYSGSRKNFKRNRRTNTKRENLSQEFQTDSSQHDSSLRKIRDEESASSTLNSNKKTLEDTVENLDPQSKSTEKCVNETMEIPQQKIEKPAKSRRKIADKRSQKLLLKIEETESLSQFSVKRTKPKKKGRPRNSSKQRKSQIVLKDSEDSKFTDEKVEPDIPVRCERKTRSSKITSDSEIASSPNNSIKIRRPRSSRNTYSSKLNRRGRPRKRSESPLKLRKSDRFRKNSENLSPVYPLSQEESTDESVCSESPIKLRKSVRCKKNSTAANPENSSLESPSSQEESADESQYLVKLRTRIRRGRDGRLEMQKNVTLNEESSLQKNSTNANSKKHVKKSDNKKKPLLEIPSLQQDNDDGIFIKSTQEFEIYEKKNICKETDEKNCTKLKTKNHARKSESTIENSRRNSSTNDESLSETMKKLSPRKIIDENIEPKSSPQKERKSRLRNIIYENIKSKNSLSPIKQKTCRRITNNPEEEIVSQRIQQRTPINSIKKVYVTKNLGKNIRKDFLSSSPKEKSSDEDSNSSENHQRNHSNPRKKIRLNENIASTPKSSGSKRSPKISETDDENSDSSTLILSSLSLAEFSIAEEINGVKNPKKSKQKNTSNISNFSSLQNPRLLTSYEDPDTQEVIYRDENLLLTKPKWTKPMKNHHSQKSIIPSTNSQRWNFSQTTTILQLKEPRIILHRLINNSIKTPNKTHEPKASTSVKNLKKPNSPDGFIMPSYDGAADLSSSDSDVDPDLTIAKEEKRVCTYQSVKKSSNRDSVATPKKRKPEENPEIAGPSAKRPNLRKSETAKKSSPCRSSMLKSPGRFSGYYSPLKIIVTSPKVRKETEENACITPKRDRLHEKMMRGRILSTKSSISELGEKLVPAAIVGSERSGELDFIASSESGTTMNRGKDSKDVRKKLEFSVMGKNEEFEESSDSVEEFNKKNISEESGVKFITINDTQASIEQSIRTENRDPYEVTTDEDDEADVTFSQFIDEQMKNQSLMDKSTIDTQIYESRVFIRPKFNPPTRKNVIETMETYGIPKYRNQEPFFSVDADVPKQKELAHKMLKVPGKSLKDTSAFVSSVNGVTGINRWRRMKVMEFNPSIGRFKDIDMKIALGGNQKITLKPLLEPPTRKEVKDWLRAREYLAKKRKQEEEDTRRNKIEEKEIEVEIGKNENEENCSNDSDLSVVEKTLSRESKMKLDGKLRKDSEEETGEARRGSGDSNSTEMDRSLLSVLAKSRLFREKETSRDLGVSCGQIEFLSDSTRSNVANENLRNTKALTRYQYLTIMCLEVHVTTRGDLLPDAQYDSIAALFYSVQSDVPPTSSIKPLEHGVIVLADSDKSKNRMYYSYASNVPWSITFAENEEALLNSLVNLITLVDPEILIGWELETLSWGYVFQRASNLGMNIYKRVSRIPATQGKWETQQRDMEKLSEVKLPGRIVLDIWRLMRHEAALLSYTFESMMHHVLNERIPCPSFKTLTDWWSMEKLRPSRWRVVEHYSVRVLGVLRILDQLDIIGRTSELARLFGIQFFEVFSRGSQYRVESVMLRLAKPLNYIAVSPSPQQRASMRAMEALPLIMEPESMFYSDPLIVLDFQSLYPSIIIAHNICFSTCLGRIEHIGQPHPFEFGAYTLKVPKSTGMKLQGKVNYAPCGVAFVKPEVRLGILPRMLTEILETRFMVKKAMKDHKKDDKTLQRALHSRQMGLKFLANVTYGYTAANFSGRMPCIEVGDSVISKSKETLERAIKLVESTPKWGARVVYGDTDSLFILVPGKSKADAFVIGNEIADAVTQSNPPPIKLKFEKVVYPAILQTKKRYCGYMYETPEQENPTYLAKGIETVRRDGCPAVSKILEKTLKILFETKDVSLVKKYVMRQLDKVLRGKVSIQDLTFAKEFRGLKGYKPKACVPTLELTKRLMKKDPRAVPRISERVRYVIIAGAPNQALIHCVRTPWELMNDPGLRPNAIYYVTRVIIPPLNRCLNLMGVDVNDWYREMPHRHILDNPVGQPLDKQKLTIFQYFGTIICAVCGQSSNKGICTECLSNPADSLVVIYEKLRRLDRTHCHVTSICQSCVGKPDVADCASLDCPVLYRRAQSQRELTQATHLRSIIECGNNLEL